MAGDDTTVSIVAELVAKVDNAVQGFQKAGNDMNAAMLKLQSGINTTMTQTSDQMKSTMETGGKEAGAASAASFGESFTTGMLAAAAYAGAQFLKSVQQNVEAAAAYASQLNIQVVETGASTAQLQKLSYAFKSVGLDGEGLSMAITRMGTAIDQAATTHNGRSMLERMGLDPKQLKAEPVLQQFDQIADAISKLKSKTDQVAAARSIFSRTGAQMLPLLDQGSAGITSAGNKAQGQGAIISDDDLAKLRALHEAMLQAQQTAQAFYVTMASPFLTPIEQGIRWVQQLQAEFQKLSTQVRGSVLFAALASTALAFEQLLDVVKELKVFPSFLNEVLVKMSAFLGPVGEIIAAVGLLWNAWQSDFGGIRAVAETVFNAVVFVIQEVRAAFNSVAQTEGPALRTTFTQISAALQPVLKDLADLIAWLLQALPIGEYFRLVLMGLGFALQMAGQIILGVIETVHDLLDLFIMTGADIVEVLRNMVQGFTNVLNAIADVVAAIPGLSGMAVGLRTAADETQRWADNLEHVRVQLDKHLTSTTGVHSTTGRAKPVVSHAATAAGTSLADPATGSAASNAIQALKDALEPLKDALADSELHLHGLEQQLKRLGELDTPAKLAQGQRIYTEEISATAVELKRQHDLLVATADAAAKLGQMARTAPDAKSKKEYDAAQRTMVGEVRSDKSKEDDIITKLHDLLAQRDMQRLDSGITMRADATDRANQPLEAAAASAERHRKLTEAGVHGTSKTPQAKQGIDISEATDALLTAQAKQAIAANNAAAADANYAAGMRDHTITQAKLLELSKQMATADQAQDDATVEVTIANHALAQAQTELARAAQQTLKSSFDSLTTSLEGPFASAIKDITTEIAGGMNPATAIMSSLFTTLAKDSRSFNDIQKVLTAVAEALAKALDAMRPIVDLLLGVLTGVVNMFIGLFNVIATVLNMFGLHIQKIQAVNDQLAILGNGVPLLQVTHDLPTANEYNDGKWGPLITAQMQNANNNLNSNLTVGFNNQFNRLGEILGTLLAIKVVLAVAGIGPSMSKMFGGGSKGGPMGILGSLLSFGSGSSNSTSASMPGEGSVGATTATATWQTGGAADTTLNKHLTTGGTLDQTLTNQVAPGGQMDNTFTNFLTKFGPMIASIGVGAATGGAGGALGGIGGDLLGGMFGRMIGGAAGGPIGALLGGMAGTALSGLLGGLFGGGKGPDPEKDPYTNTTSAPKYGQGLADLTGQNVVTATGTYSDPDLAGGGQTQGTQISDYIKSGGAGLDAATVALFSNWQDGLTSINNGVVTFKNGQKDMWDDAIAKAASAMQVIGSNIAYSLQNATMLNLSSIYGNGQVSASNGGYSVGGASASASASAQPAAPQVNVNIAQVVGADPDTLQTAFAPIVAGIGDSLSRLVAQTTRTNAYATGRNNT
jgi:hypothetical protein